MPLLTSLTSVSLSGTLSLEPALALSALSQASAAAWPSASATELTIGQKSVSAGASSILPFHFGSARSRTDVGQLRRR